MRRQGAAGGKDDRQAKGAWGWQFEHLAPCGIQSFVERRFIDDLPTVHISRLRASGVITLETTEFVVRLGDVEQTVGVMLQRFRSGGSWSYFICPCCGQRARTLKLFGGQLLRSRCCRAGGLLYKTDPMSIRQRAERRIPQLRAMLESKTPLRLKPSTLWGTMERRKRLEAALREAEFRVAQR